MKKEKLPKLVIRPEFEKKLRELKILTRFKKNCANPKWVISDPLKQRIAQNNTLDWNEFINAAFFWVTSPEGTCYWSNIAMMNL